MGTNLKSGTGALSKEAEEAKNLCATRLKAGRVDAVGPANVVGAREGLCRRRRTVSPSKAAEIGSPWWGRRSHATSMVPPLRAI